MAKTKNTIDNPPTFFYDDQEKWKKKFAKQIREREYFKRQFARTSQLTCQTRNTNIKVNEDM